jgi:hypothetical protein
VASGAVLPTDVARLYEHADTELSGITSEGDRRVRLRELTEHCSQIAGADSVLDFYNPLAEKHLL